MSHILVAYASKRGSTEEVARAIAGQLRDDGHTVDVLPAAAAPGPVDYDGVVLGGSLYIGHWHPDALRYLRRNWQALAAGPLAVFALGPLELTAEKVADSRRQLDAALAKFPELTPDLVRVFGGVIDAEQLHYPFSRLMPAGDARDWAAIRAWTNEVEAVFERTEMLVG